jgi:hypothetical protein
LEGFGEMVEVLKGEKEKGERRKGKCNISHILV